MYTTDVAQIPPEEHGRDSVESDGEGRITQYEACDRGTHMAQLKLDDSETKVTKITPQPFRQQPYDSGYYNMSAPRHGVALIINNKILRDRLRHKDRIGTKRDEYNLIQTFLYLGYRPIVCTNLTSGEMLHIFETLDDILKDSDSKSKANAKVAHDSFVCCFLSHGTRDAIYGADSEPVKREDMERRAGMSKTLNSRPKIFFVQACQGDEYGEAPVERQQADDTSSARADFYICLATTLGDKSYRDIYTGSWFITEVCKVLCKYASCDSLHTDFQLRLNQNVSNNETYRYFSKKQRYAQQPASSNQLQRHVHFFSNF